MIFKAEVFYSSQLAVHLLHNELNLIGQVSFSESQTFVYHLYPQHGR